MCTTHTHPTRPANFLRTLLLLVTVLCGLAAIRPVQAQGLYLPNYAISITLTYAPLHLPPGPYIPGPKSSGVLKVSTQDTAGNFTGTLTVNGLGYNVTGTLHYRGSIPGSTSYTLSLSAIYQERLFNRVIATKTLQLYNGFIEQDYWATFSIAFGNFDWSNYSYFGGVFTYGSGTFDGSGKILSYRL